MLATGTELETERVVIRQEQRTIEIRERAGGWDDLVLGTTFVVGSATVAVIVANPINTASFVLLPFAALFLMIGGLGLVQRLRHPAVVIDRWTLRVKAPGYDGTLPDVPAARTRRMVYFAGGLPKRHWAVELAALDERVLVVNGLLSRDEAEAVCDCLNGLLSGAGGRAS